MNRIENLHNNVFSKKNVELFEKNIMLLAVVGFIIHLLLIFIENYYALDIFSSRTNLSSNPISALYTPFTFILVYEAFLLIYYLPRSFTTSVAKEYEIISLVLIRKIFKDIPEISLEPDQILNENNLQLMYDLLAVIVIFYLIYLFKKTWVNTPKRKTNKNLEKFINYKKLLSILLVPTLLILCFINFYEWFIQVFISQSYTDNLNGVFFIDFFTILILVDVFILLISFQYTERYSQLIRNTGFIISTILLRLSFSAEGLYSILLLILGVVFGLVILRIYKLAEENY
ncbi:MAG: hypothetical protein ACJ0OW_05390 [Flavobacteriaceae bacterium]|nr:hypothetical protein [Flavobacteriaceae bacterium]|tara:strand:+ start:501 stop:1361 length:861 start_codon:yes stop_codon:yes gene_type:complete